MASSTSQQLFGEDSSDDEDVGSYFVLDRDDDGPPRFGRAFLAHRADRGPGAGLRGRRPGTCQIDRVPGPPHPCRRDPRGSSSARAGGGGGRSAAARQTEGRRRAARAARAARAVAVAG